MNLKAVPSFFELLMNLIRTFKNMLEGFIYIKVIFIVRVSNNRSVQFSNREPKFEDIKFEYGMLSFSTQLFVLNAKSCSGIWGPFFNTKLLCEQ
jgi:hypothetical protein